MTGDGIAQPPATAADALPIEGGNMAGNASDSNNDRWREVHARVASLESISTWGFRWRGGKLAVTLWGCYNDLGYRGESSAGHYFLLSVRLNMALKGDPAGGRIISSTISSCIPGV
jgi:hypothetical protein